MVTNRTIDIDPDEIEGQFEETLTEEAERFGGGGESTAVPSTHIRLTSEDLRRIANGELVDCGAVTACCAESVVDAPNPSEIDGYALGFTEDTLRELARGGIVRFGIRNVDGTNQFLVASGGGVSDKLGRETDPLTLEQEKHPELR